MNCWRLLSLCCALSGALLMAVASSAQPVAFKCIDAEGRISYQDRACPPSAAQSRPRLDPIPFYTPPVQPPPAPAPIASRFEYPAAAPPPPPATQYRCTSHDGNSYVTSDPAPRGHYVPVLLSMRGGVHLGGGALRADLPVLNAPPSAGLATAYTYVEDRCHPMPLGELCAYWYQRDDEVHHDLRGAFKDTRSLLEQEQAGLRGQLQTYCGR